MSTKGPIRRVLLPAWQETQLLRDRQQVAMPEEKNPVCVVAARDHE